jgi:hypothetical protein
VELISFQLVLGHASGPLKVVCVWEAKGKSGHKQEKAGDLFLFFFYKQTFDLGCTLYVPREQSESYIPIHF